MTLVESQIDKLKDYTYICKPGTADCWLLCSIFVLNLTDNNRYAKKENCFPGL